VHPAPLVKAPEIVVALSVEPLLSCHQQLVLLSAAVGHRVMAVRQLAALLHGDTSKPVAARLK
jgi:hypothetical protein